MVVDECRVDWTDQLTAESDLEPMSVNSLHCYEKDSAKYYQHCMTVMLLEEMPLTWTQDSIDHRLTAGDDDVDDVIDDDSSINDAGCRRYGRNS